MLELKKGVKAKLLRNKSTTGRVKEYSRKPQRIDELDETNEFSSVMPRKHGNTCHFRAVNAGSLDCATNY